jgi:uncharacterized protein YodC (DUF2158 family)
MSRKFRVGDKVKSTVGGPPLLVERLKGEIVTCGWWDKPNWRTHDFPTTALEPFDPVAEMAERIKEIGLP